MNKQTIEVLKGLMKVHGEMGCVGECVQSQALSQAIQWGEALQSAGGELPERKELKGSRPPAQRIYFNKTLDLCKPILAKYKLEVGELKDAVEKALDKNEATKILKHRIEELHEKLAKKELRILELKQENKRLAEGAIEKPPYKENLQQELATLKAKIRELEVNAKLGNISYKQAIQLQQENATLKAELSTLKKKLTESKKSL